MERITKLVFLTLRPISAFEEEKWCFTYLRSQGFDIKVLDLTRLINSVNKLEQVFSAVKSPLVGDYIYHVTSYKEFERLVAELSGSALFIDYLIGLSPVTLREERIFRILGKYKARYTFLSAGALPLPLSDKASGSGKLKKIQLQLEKAISNPYRLLNYLASKVILLLTRHGFVYPVPIVIFGGASEALHHYVRARGIKIDTIVPINSFDYDFCIPLLRSWGHTLPPPEDVCVFLDEAATHHSDFSILGIISADPKIYYENMNRFFDFVEKYTGFKVVIAAHPRSHYNAMPDVFCGRSVVMGKTAELVAKSKMIIMHMSTSLSFAVIFNKPVVPVKIPGMSVNGQMNQMVETMAAAIGRKPVDIERDKLSPLMLCGDVDVERYSEYKERYVISREAGDLSAWEVVAKYISNMPPQLGAS